MLVVGSMAAAGFVQAAPKHIPGKHIVTLAPGARAEAVAARHGAEVEAVYTAALHGFAGTVPEARLQALQNDPEVAAVEPDVEVQAFRHQITLAGGDPILSANGETIPTGVQRIGVSAQTDVQAVGVAVIDTGISLSHPDLNVAGGVSFIRGNKSGDDDNGHGSHVAGTIAAKRNNSTGVVGVAPNARLFAVKVLDRRGSGSLSAVISGVDWVTKNANTKKIQVANMSLGFQGTSASLDTAISNSVNKASVTYAVAAGNSDADSQLFSPANHPLVITVSAIADSDGQCGALGAATSYGADDTFASFSNWGGPVDLAAPGVDILSTYKEGGYATASGTSMASPHVAGAAALFIANNPTALPADVQASLLSIGTPQGNGCNADGSGGFTGDPDTTPEPLVNTRNL